MPALRLKTKLVFAITAMVLAIVATLSAVYVTQVVRQRIHEAREDGEFIAHEVFSVARDALEIDLTNSKIDLNDPQQVGDAIQEALQTDASLDSLLQSIKTWSPVILDATIVDSRGRALLHTTEEFTGKIIKSREDFVSIDEGGIWKQIKMIYGAVSSKIDRLGRQMRDVKEVFSALKENLDQMMANLQDGVMLFTSDFRAVMVSASAEQFIGKPRGEMLGCYPGDIFSGQSRLAHAILEAFETRSPMLQEEIETENGRRLQISLDFIEERGERIGALLTLRDAESVHRIEDEIELSRRLAAIGRLTSGVAHEVKNPINAIVVHLEVLRQKLHEIDPDTRRHMDVIGNEIRRLDRVVQTLVDFTRRVDLRLTDMDMRKLVDEVVSLAALEAQGHNVHIVRENSLEALPVRIDADLVKQAVLNIVINGVQAMPQGGNLYISTHREGEGVLIVLRAEGLGVAADLRDKLYNLYF